VRNSIFAGFLCINKSSSFSKKHLLIAWQWEEENPLDEEKPNN